MTAVRHTTPGSASSVRFDGFISYSHTADGLVAPRLQAALQSFAKPWWRRRAVRIFRDESSLSANPHLWFSIAAALDASDWFILLTSPDAATSGWVDREVAYWRAHKDPDRIIPILTEGNLVWDEAAGRLDTRSSVPPSLIDAFTGEPRWVDLRWVREETQLDLRNGRFRDVVADVSSSLRGIPKDDLESEEVRQHRRTRRTAWAAGSALAVLAVAALAGAIIAVDQRDRAETQQALAEAAADRAESAESLARSRELAASAINLLEDDPELSILLGLEAIASAPLEAEQPVEAINALREATHATRLRRRQTVSPSGGFVTLDLSPDGTRLAVLSHLEGSVTVSDVASGRRISTYSDPTTIDDLFSLSFSADGALLAVGVADSTRQVFALPVYVPVHGREDSEATDDLPPRVVIVRVESGEVVRTIEYPSCAEARPVPRFSPDGAWLAVAGLSGPACQAGQWAVELLDAESFELMHRWDTPGDLFLSWTADGSRFATAGDTPRAGTTVYDTSSREVVVRVDAGGGLLSPDGSSLVVDAIGGIDVIDLATGNRTDILTGFDLLVLTKAFSPDGSLLIVGTSERALFVFDLESGGLMHRLGPSGSPISSACTDLCESLWQSNLEGQVLTWDLSTRAGGEFSTVDTGYFINASSIATAGDVGVFLGFASAREHPDVVPFDRVTGTIGDQRRPTETNSPVPLPDGRIVLLEVSTDAPEFGPVVVWDPASDTVEDVTGCWVTRDAVEASGFGSSPIPCTDREGFHFAMDQGFLSPDGSSMLITEPGGGWKIFDARTLEERTVPALPNPDHRVVAFGGTWIVSSDDETATVVDVSDGQALATLEPATAFSWPDVSTDGRVLALYRGLPGEVTLYDTGTWSRITSFLPGAVRGISLSPDASKILTAQTDGYVRIWGTTTGDELMRIPLFGASDGYWLDESHVVVGTATGLWTTITLDPEELEDLAASRLTRGFTDEECATYRIDPCPDLQTITSR